MKLTDSLKNQIIARNKKRQDISDLLIGVDIRNQDLSYSIIKSFNRTKEDISGCNFSNAVIGEENIITNLCGTNMFNCNFFNCKFLGTVWLINASAINCNFNNCDLSNVDFRKCDFSKSTFRSAIIKICSEDNKNAKFSLSFITEIMKYWDIK